ncbi:endonuclease [Thioflexithrix psekupsensis]|nr:endonuclease [Thioflexithrix psekupsensis]
MTLRLFYFLGLSLIALWLSGCGEKTETPNQSSQANDSQEKSIGRLPMPLAAPSSFTAAKNALYNQVYAGHSYTFYCGCPFDRREGVDLEACGVTPRKNLQRASRVEAEHVFPAHQFGHFRACWREPLCTDSKGQPFKGRECCLETDEVFRTAHNDLHNLFPAVGEINGDRSNYNWGMLSGVKSEYGRCEIKIDSSIRRAEPPANVRGDIARVYFYMAATYGFNLSRQDVQLFTAWHRQDPPDDWERERNRRIARIQGNENPFIVNADSVPKE